MSKKAVVFDLDGTLLNTLDDLADSTNFALSCLGFPERSIEEIRRFVGNGNVKLIERSVPDGTDKEQLNACYNAFIKHYKEHMLDKTRPYEGIPELLRSLKEREIKLAIVTNKTEFAAKEICARVFGDLPDLVIGANDTLKKKPAPDGVLYALDKLGVSKSQAVFVGDSEVDIQTAINAEIDCIGVLWGFRDEEVLLEMGVKKTAKTASQLGKLI